MGNSQIHNHYGPILLIGILYQLRNYLNLKMLRQLYYALIYPYLNYIYGAMCWGNTYQTILNKIYTKPNKCIRSIFFLQTNKSPLSHTTKSLKS